MTTGTLSNAKTHLARLLAEVNDLGEAIVITRSGLPTAVLLSVEEYEGLLETLEILADPVLSEAVRTGLEEASNQAPISHEDLWDALGA